jgi:hypothetical protein
MALSAYQVSKTWDEVDGTLEAAELFPNLLPDSTSELEACELVEDEDELRTEEREGRYHGCPQDVDEDIEAALTEMAEAEFRSEALEAAKTYLRTHSTIFHENLEVREIIILEAAAAELGIVVPWDTEEASQIAKNILTRKAVAEAEAAEDEVLEKATGISASDLRLRIFRCVPCGISLEYELWPSIRKRILAGESVESLRAEMVTKGEHLLAQRNQERQRRH